MCSKLSLNEFSPSSPFASDCKRGQPENEIINYPVFDLKFGMQPITGPAAYSPTGWANSNSDLWFTKNWCHRLWFIQSQSRSPHAAKPFASPSVSLQRSRKPGGESEVEHTHCEASHLPLRLPPHPVWLLYNDDRRLHKVTHLTNCPREDAPIS